MVATVQKEVEGNEYCKADHVKDWVEVFPRLLILIVHNFRMVLRDLVVIHYNKYI
jgi:hypothetical protein